MGCSSSKHQSNRDDRNAPLARSMSYPGHSVKMEGGSSSKILWKSSKPDITRNDIIDKGVSMSQVVCTQQIRSSSKLKPVKEEDTATAMHEEQSDTRGSAIMDGLFHRMPVHRNESRKHRQCDRSATFSPAQEVDAATKASVWGKCCSGDELGSGKTRSMDNTFTCADSGTSSFRSLESMDGNSGLRLLLSPIATPSRSFTSSTRGGTLSRTLSSSGRFTLNYNSDSGMGCPRTLNTHTIPGSKIVSLEIEGMGDFEEPGSPLFDPSILATFEKAVEASSDDSWHSSDVSTSFSSDTCSDADSSDRPKENGIYQEARGFPGTQSGMEDKPCKIAGDILRYRSKGIPKKRHSSSKVAPLHSDVWTKKDSLEGFELKCPPGCEDKIVFYFTSLRGIRKTYEDCCMVRLVLKGFGVHVDERDVWMHSKFRQELITVVGAGLSVPRLFIKGRYIGGAEDVKRLHDEGILGNLLEGLPAELNNMCDMCGGVRFIPCTTCSGSCKMISIDEIARCPDCNENGLIMCPSCDW